MIKMYEQVPQVYLNASRDFQYLSRLIDIVLNSVKHNIDGIYDLPNWPENPEIAELLAFTLGFKVKRNYDKEQLAALVSILPSILKCKGTKKSIDLLGNALIKASGTPGTYLSKLKDNVLEVILPKEQVDVNLFLDVLPYILPAGLSCRIIRRTVHQNTINTEAGYESVLKAALFDDYTLAGIRSINASPEDPRLAEPYLRGLQKAPDAHTILGEGSILDPTSPYAPNIGRLETNVVPVLWRPDFISGIVEPGYDETLRKAFADKESQLLEEGVKNESEENN